MCIAARSRTGHVPDPGDRTNPSPGHPGGALPVHLRRPGRTLVMGVVNVTPDSFSDGGQWFAPDVAVAHGRELLAQGADIVDVGGESTRPGAARVAASEELRRVLPVVRELAGEGAVVSIDTTRAEVAAAALEAGAIIVNDVSGGLADPAMAGIVAGAGVPYVVSHWRGHSDVMDGLDDYDDVVRDVARELAARVRVLRETGVRREQLILDPGLGFAKVGDANWELLARLDELIALGYPVLVGASRKRFLGHLLAEDRRNRGPRTGGDPAGTREAPHAASPADTPRPAGTGLPPDAGLAADPVPTAERDAATAAVTALAARAGAWAVRVHEVPASRDAVLVARAWQEARTRRAPTTGTTAAQEPVTTGGAAQGQPGGGGDGRLAAGPDDDSRRRDGA